MFASVGDAVGAASEDAGDTADDVVDVRTDGVVDVVHAHRTTTASNAIRRIILERYAGTPPPPRNERPMREPSGS